jgi:hypothetical protein
MAINSYDIVSTLQALGMMKYWKGKHIILKKQVSRFGREREDADYDEAHVNGVFVFCREGSCSTHV